MKTNEFAAYLSEIPLFSSLPPSVIESLAEALQPQKLDRDEALFRKGDRGSSMYIVDEGALTIVIEDAHGRELVLNKVGHGAVIGEISLIDEDPRAASVIAAEESTLYRLDRNQFMDVMSNYDESLLDSLRDVSAYLRFGYMVDTLRSLPLFDGVPESILFELASKMTMVTLQNDDVLFEKGDAGDALYLIKSGWVKIVTEDDQGEELVLNQSGIGEAIGEMALIEEQPRSASVVAIGDVEMLRLNRDVFLETLAEQPVLAMFIMRRMSGRLRFATTYIEEAIKLSRQVAEGDYSFAMEQIQDTQDKIVGDDVSDEKRAGELLTAFFAMIKEVQEREEALKQQLHQLTIQIDQAQREDEYKKLTSSPFFADLKAAADQARAERDKKE